jgi:probable lipoprotein NlpC
MPMVNLTMKGRFWLILAGVFLLLGKAGGLFAAVPIENSSLGGLSAANARSRLLAAAEAYLGTPYRYGGIDSRGLDCSGLIFLSFRDALHASVPRTTSGLYSWSEKIPSNEMSTGDLVFFITEGADISHVGIYAGNGRFIHAASAGPKTGVMYSRLDESYWKRTFTGAGRALPLDGRTETAGDTAAVSAPAGGGESRLSAPEPGKNPAAASPKGSWDDDHRFFTGLGLAASFGGFSEGSPSVLRGLAGQVRLGYKGLFSPAFRVALDLRPEWDGALGVFRLPLTLSLGTDIIQVFAGPALTLGDPVLKTGGGERSYTAGWLGELGLQIAAPPIRISGGALSFFGELCWQPYFLKTGGDDENGENPGADFSANMRFSTGLRYSWVIH